MALVLVAALSFAGSATASTWVDLNRTINQGKVSVLTADGRKTQTLDPYNGKSIEILILGQDTRDGDGNASIGGESASLKGNHQSDTAMVMQIGADRTWVNLVSIPRDSLVEFPGCTTTNGALSAQSGMMFNAIFAQAYAQGGDLASAASCTMTAVNALTGLNVQHFIVVDFNGLKNMIDALGGVDICVPVDTTDSKTHLNLARGLQHLDGTQATQYARMRHGTGTDGSDIMRTTRQQYLIRQLLNEALSKNLFTQSGQLYQLAKSALQSLNISQGMADASTLVGLAMSLKNLKVSHLYAQTIPVTAAPSDPNRVVWADKAATVWAKMQAGQPLVEQSASTSKKKSGTTESKKKDTTNDSDSSSGSSGSEDQSAQSSTATTPTADPKTGLITDAAGQLIDPETKGIVDPETGAIRDADTGQYVGIAYKYLNATVCATS